MSACPNCNTAKGNKQTLQCDGCQADVHLACVGMSQEDIRVTRNKSRSIKIVCNNCSKNLGQLEELKTLISSLKDDFNNKLDALTKKFENVAVPPRTYEEIVVEATERVNRSRNIILTGVPEPQGSTEERTVKDSATVMEIINVALNKNDSSVKPVRVIRLGRSSNINRPLKVIFDNNFVSKEILRMKNNLAGTPFKHVTIKDDKTPQQIEYLNGLRAELKERIDSGETHLTIKYVKGIPTITNIASKNQH